VADRAASTSAVTAAAIRLRAAAPSGVLVEPKGLSVTCHYRANPALEPQVTALTREVAAAPGCADSSSL